MYRAAPAQRERGARQEDNHSWLSVYLWGPDDRRMTHGLAVKYGNKLDEGVSKKDAGSKLPINRVEACFRVFCLLTLFETPPGSFSHRLGSPAGWPKVSSPDPSGRTRAARGRTEYLSTRLLQ